MEHRYKTYKELYTALQHFNCPTCFTVNFFIISVQNTMECDCNDTSIAEEKFKTFFTDLTEFERVEVENFLNNM